jgi:hypothetical protein
MRAIVLEKFGGLDSLVYRDIPEPESLVGHVVIQVKAFGLNHAEMHYSRGASRDGSQRGKGENGCRACLRRSHCKRLHGEASAGKPAQRVPATLQSPPWIGGL